MATFSGLSINALQCVTRSLIRPQGRSAPSRKLSVAVVNHWPSGESVGEPLRLVPAVYVFRLLPRLKTPDNVPAQSARAAYCVGDPVGVLVGCPNRGAALRHTERCPTL